MSKRAKIGIEHGKFRNPEYLIVELDKRLAEDDANPNAWSVGKLSEPMLKLDGAIGCSP